MKSPMQGTLTTRPKAKLQRRRWLVLFLRACWFAAAILGVEILLLSIQPAYRILTTICHEEPCLTGQLTPAGLEALTALGLTPHFYALYNIILTLVLVAIYGVVAIIIFRAQPNEPIALYVSLALLLFGVFVTEVVEAAETVAVWIDLAMDFLPGIAFISFAILFYIFPDGRFIPRWTRWAAIAWAVLPFAVVPFMLYDQELWGPLALALGLTVLVITCIVAPIYRYRYVSSPSERQQTKWVVFALLEVLLIVLVFTGEVLPRLAPAVDVKGSLADFVVTLIEFSSLAALPIMMGMAVLRYRLWAVDVLINRTLVYVPLTSILTVIYTTSITFSQKFFATVTGDQSPAVAIFTTIILTTTFTPLKNTLQNWVDHYFKEPPDRLKGLKELEKRLFQVVDVLDRRSVARQVVEQAVQASNARGAALYLRDGGQMRLAYITPKWAVREGKERLPLTWEGQVLGQLVLGARRDGQAHTQDECAAIQKAAARIAYGLTRVYQWQASPSSPPSPQSAPPEALPS
ncbi:MAG TPA: hypothetical protein VNK95_09140 [Caldilineaceae bacterium]|nr:hypothetical protein [Caldilineaceae bacterium]